MSPITLHELAGDEEVLFTAKIAGEEIQFPKDANVREALTKVLEEKGIDSFTIIIDGEEIISTDDIPAVFADCRTVEVQRYVKAG